MKTHLTFFFVFVFLIFGCTKRESNNSTTHNFAENGFFKCILIDTSGSYFRKNDFIIQKIKEDIKNIILSANEGSIIKTKSIDENSDSFVNNISELNLTAEEYKKDFTIKESKNELLKRNQDKKIAQYNEKIEKIMLPYKKTEIDKIFNFIENRKANPSQETDILGGIISCQNKYKSLIKDDKINFSRADIIIYSDMVDTLDTVKSEYFELNEIFITAKYVIEPVTKNKPPDLRKLSTTEYFNSLRGKWKKIIGNNFSLIRASNLI